jgi:hypothetical protein
VVDLKTLKSAHDCQRRAFGARPAAAIGRVSRQPEGTSSSWATKQAHKGQLELANPMRRFPANTRTPASASNFLLRANLILPARLPTWAGQQHWLSGDSANYFFKNVNNACISSNV